MGKILCLGRNYVEHAKEMHSEVPTRPVIFLKPATALIRDGEDIVIEADSRKVRLAPVPLLPVFDEATARRRGYGSMKGQFEVTDSFFEPLPEDELKFWEGRGGDE